MKHLIILALLVLPLVAAVRIDMIYPDAFNESGSEFVLLNNTGDAVNVDGWHLATATSDTDATLSGTIPANSTYLMADAGWSTGKDDSAWPDADHEETLTMPNSAGFVQLFDADGNVVDTVGYGDAQRFDGTPAAAPDEGFALVRVNDTGNNSADFVAEKPRFSMTGGESGATILVVNVTDSAPHITDVSLADAAPEPGIQALDISNSTITVNVTVVDDNGLGNLTVTAGGIALTLQEGVWTGYCHIENGSCHIVADDGTLQDATDISVELLPAVSIDVQQTLALKTEAGVPANGTIIVRNTGGLPVDIQVGGTVPALGQTVVGQVQYGLFGEEFPLTDSFRGHAVNLTPGSDLAIDVQVTPGAVGAGTYLGRLVVVAVAR